MAGEKRERRRLLGQEEGGGVAARREVDDGSGRESAREHPDARVERVVITRSHPHGQAGERAGVRDGVVGGERRGRRPRAGRYRAGRSPRFAPGPEARAALAYDTQAALARGPFRDRDRDRHRGGPGHIDSPGVEQSLAPSGPWA